MPPFKDLSGQRFGRLTAVISTRTKTNRVAWICRCDCGKEKTVQSADLLSGASRSCGCYQKEMAKKAQKKHDFYGTRIYRVWRNMKDRCLNPKNEMYMYYGARGIGICEKWHEFMGFYEDMGPTFESHLTLERKDVNQGYSPDNCRWATQSEQANNKTNNILVTVDGITDTLKNTCRRKNARYDRVRQRLAAGLNIDEALRLPAQPGKKLKTP